MAAALETYVDRQPLHTTLDRHAYCCSDLSITVLPVGVLRGFDQTLNLILDDTHERVLSPSEAAQRIDLGLYIVRGDNVAVIGELDPAREKEAAVESKHAEAIKPVIH